MVMLVTIGRVMCEHYCLSVLMYTPGMTVMSLLLKNRYESKRSRDFFETENALAFALFLKKNFSAPLSLPSVLLEIEHPFYRQQLPRRLPLFAL